MKIIKCVYNALIILLCCYTISIQMKEIYDIKADDLMDTIISKLNKRNFQLHAPYETTTEISKSTITKEILTTSELRLVVKDAQNLSAAQLHLRKRKLDIKTLLETNIGPVQYIHSVDEINVQTRRFAGIRNFTTYNVLRHIDPNYEDPDMLVKDHFKVLDRVLQLMEQFIYQTKYQLPYSQILRKKYINHVKYRIGYCFALLKNLKRQQMIVYSTLKTYITVFTSLYVHLKLYEKVVKLDVDIKDVIAHIVYLNDVRKKNEQLKKLTTKKKN